MKNHLDVEELLDTETTENIEPIQINEDMIVDKGLGNLLKNLYQIGIN